MTTPIIYLPAIVVSLAGIGYLLATDQKRRRSRGVRKAAKLPQSKFAGWAIVIVPGLLLLMLGEPGAFLAWFGSTIVGAWLIVSLAGRGVQAGNGTKP